MSGLMSGRLAWSMWVLTVLAAALALRLASLNEPSSSLWNTALVSLLIFAFSTVGALVASRHSENPIGWVFCTGAFVWMLGEFALEYGVYALNTTPGALPAGAWMAWFGGWGRGMGWLLLVTLLLLLFPTGRLPSPRWSPVLWGVLIYVVLFTLGSWISPALNDPRLDFVRNPLGLESDILALLNEILYLVLPLLPVASGAAVIARFRRSTGDERQQLKWFVYAVALMVIVFTFWISLALLGLVTPNALVFTIPLFGIPAATGIAIFKYRLYDIDFLINRTLVYGALTAALALVYFGGVALLQGAFRVLTGQEQQPQLVIVVSTLTIAALFNPLRRRIQTFIDRHFYRRKYDAAKTLEAFSARLREEADLEALNEDLVAVARETVQPMHVALWLRSPEWISRDTVE